MGFGHGHFGRFAMFDKVLSKKTYVAVLKTLGDEPQTGYQVMRALAGQVPPWLYLGPEKVYPVLQLQVDRGHVTAQATDGQTRYALTETGRTYLAERVADGEGEPFSQFPFQGTSPEDWMQHKQQFKAMFRAFRGMWHHGHHGHHSGPHEHPHHEQRHGEGA